MIYYEHHLGDYVRDTAHLSMVEDGAYRRLLDAYYRTEQPLPLNFKSVCRLVRANTKAERDAVKAVLAEFFQESADGWRQRRADDEIAYFRSKSSKARTSANKRWSSHRSKGDIDANASPENPKGICDGNANASPEHPKRICETDAQPMLSNHQSPITKLQEEDRTLRSASVGDLSPSESETAPPNGLKTVSETRRAELRSITATALKAMPN